MDVHERPADGAVTGLDLCVAAVDGAANAGLLQPSLLWRWREARDQCDGVRIVVALDFFRPFFRCQAAGPFNRLQDPGRVGPTHTAKVRYFLFARWPALGDLNNQIVAQDATGRPVSPRRGVLAQAVGPDSLRFVTHVDVGDDAVAGAVAAFGETLRDGT